MSPAAFVSTVLCLTLVQQNVLVDAKREYVARVPNGNNVGGAHALGHIAWDGGGPLNGFGEAFAAAGFQWTRSLCKGDADGDGQTNGEELGDPCCVWVTGSGKLPMITDVVSHPGDIGRKLNESDLHNRQLVCQAMDASPSSSSSSSSSGSVDQSSDGAGSPGFIDIDLKSGRPPAPPTTDLPTASAASLSSLHASILPIVVLLVSVVLHRTLALAA